MEKIKIIMPYGKKNKIRLICGKSKTKQAMKNDCDITNILRKHGKTGLIDHVNLNQAVYDDLTDYDFQEAQNKLISASNMFEALPAALRKRFNNQPAEFLAFVDNPKNIAEMAFLGLIKTPPKEDKTPPKEDKTPPKEDKTPPKDVKS